MSKGKFIVFEGIDGSGKTTQLKLLSKRLEGEGIPCCNTFEPTDSPFGSLIHQCMTGRIQTDEKTIACLFAADRLDHLNNKTNGILEKINNGITVISDRYYFSSYAYHAVHMPMGWVIETNKPSAEALRPDLNIFLDIDPKESLKRITSRSSIERYEKIDILTKVRQKYFEAFDLLKNQERVEIIQAGDSPQTIGEQIFDIVIKLFK